MSTDTSEDIPAALAEVRAPFVVTDPLRSRAGRARHPARKPRDEPDALLLLAIALRKKGRRPRRAPSWSRSRNTSRTGRRCITSSASCSAWPATTGPPPSRLLEIRRRPRSQFRGRLACAGRPDGADAQPQGRRCSVCGVFQGLDQRSRTARRDGGLSREPLGGSAHAPARASQHEPERRQRDQDAGRDRAQAGPRACAPRNCSSAASRWSRASSPRASATRRS